VGTLDPRKLNTWKSSAVLNYKHGNFSWLVTCDTCEETCIASYNYNNYKMALFRREQKMAFLHDPNGPCLYV